jgi:hypothetical protein
MAVGDRHRVSVILGESVRAAKENLKGLIFQTGATDIQASVYTDTVGALVVRYETLEERDVPPRDTVEEHLMGSICLVKNTEGPAAATASRNASAPSSE